VTSFLLITMVGPKSFLLQSTRCVVLGADVIGN